MDVATFWRRYEEALSADGMRGGSIEWARKRAEYFVTSTGGEIESVCHLCCIVRCSWPDIRACGMVVILFRVFRAFRS